MRTENEIQEEAFNAGNILHETNGVGKFTGMTYEEGIQAALEWVLNQTDNKPTEN